MSLLKNLRPTKTTVQCSGGPVDVYGLRISSVLDLIDDVPELVEVFTANAGTERTSAIVNAIRKAGGKVVNLVIDQATRSGPGSAAQAHIVAIDEIEILVAAVRNTLPEDRLGKLMAEGARYLDALGVAENPSVTPGPVPSTT